jgi:hypothetical protein
MNARDRLARLATQLEALGLQERHGTAPRTIDDALPAANAITQFLQGEAATLDEAFGVAPAAHRPKSGTAKSNSLSRKRARQALKIFDLKKQRKSWLQIADHFFEDDLRTLQRTYREWKTRLQAHEALKLVRENDRK